MKIDSSKDGRNRQCRRRWALCTSLLFFLVFPGSALATQPRVSAQALVTEVLQRNSQAQALAAALSASRLRIDPAGAWPDPMLSWAVAPDTLGDEVLGTRQNWALNQPLPWPGKRGLRRRAALAGSEGMRHDLDGLRLQVSLQARQLYARWYYLHRALAINADNQRLLADLAAVARQIYATGQGSQQAVLQAELRRASLRQSALSLEQQKTVIREAINHLRDRPVGTTLAEPDELGRIAHVPPLDDVLDAAIKAQPQLLALKAREQGLEYKADLARREFYPDLRLQISHLGTMDPPEKRLQAGLALQLPLNFSRRRDELQAAQADLRELQWQYRDRLAELSAELAASHSALTQALQTLELFETELLPLAEQNLVAAQADWRSGEGSFQIVVDAEQQLLDMRLGAERTRVDEWNARAALARLAADPKLNLFEENQP